MTNKILISHDEIKGQVQQLACRLLDRFGRKVGGLRLYPIPRGGVPVAYALLSFLNDAVVTHNMMAADVCIDDIIDTGATAKRMREMYGLETFALYERGKNCEPGAWLIFPWEQTANDGGINDHIVRLLQYVGEDPDRGGLKETPERVAKAWSFWCSGYGQDIPALLKTFEDGAKGYDEMVIVRNLPFFSHCEHHMAPFFGTATIGYLPNGHIVGLSKLGRVLDAYARRLQVQERLTAQIADALMEHLHARGAGVVIKARHLCMESRGLCKQGHDTVTSVMRGVFLDNPAARAEFLAVGR